MSHTLLLNTSCQIVGYDLDSVDFFKEIWKQDIRHENDPGINIEEIKAKCKEEFKLISAGNRKHSSFSIGPCSYLMKGIIYEDKKLVKLDVSDQINEEFRSFFMNLPIPVYLWKRSGSDFVLEDFNAQAEIITQYNIGKTLNTKLSEYMKERPEDIKNFMEAFETGKVITIEKEHEYKTVPYKKFLRISYIPLFDKYIVVHTEDITSEKKAENALIQSEIQYESVLSSLTEGIVVKDVDDKVLMSNNSASQILGMTPEQLFDFSAKDTKWKVADKDGNQINPEDFPSAVTLKTGKPLNDVLFNVQEPDGSEVWISVNSRPIVNEKDTMTGVVVSFSNVTKLHNTLITLEKALIDKDVLIRELHHRTKNNLQLILSYFYLNEIDSKDPQVLSFIQNTENRILAISHVHEKLLQTQSIDTLDISPYLEKLVINILQQSTNQIKYNFDLQSHFFKSELVLSLGLIVNELVSNTVKHAFCESRENLLSMSFKKSGSEYELTVKDNGPGIHPEAEKNTKNKLGMDIVKMFANKLKGEMKVQVDNGTIITINFKDQ